MGKRSNETHAEEPYGDVHEELEHPELKHPDTKRAKQVDEPETPYELLKDALDQQEAAEKVTHVAFWFRSKDLRIEDNTALHHASQLAKEKGVPLITFYLMCAPEFEWHGTSPARTDFIIEALAGMQKELKELNIPLVFVDAPERKDKIPRVVDFLKENDISHLYANYEYEIDELRRDRKLADKIKNTQFSIYHDQTIVEPGTLKTGNGKPMRVFTPYHKTWLNIVKDDPSLLDTQPSPSPNDKSVTKTLSSLFSSPVPTAPENKRFASDADRSRIRSLWPAGHSAALSRLKSFINNQIEDYATTRSNPGKDSTSRLSAYFSSGQISMRETLSELRRYNKNSSDFSPSGSSAGVTAWVRELVFRELYRQTTLTIPHNSMNLPQNLKFDFVHWESDEAGWEKWYKGTTGVPLVDAGMRQLNTEAYMHNRARMNVSSYLTCNLLIDYRRGERYFAEQLIDWDLSNNTQGWEPSYTVFNPTSQAERNDPDGEYIRKWVPELKDVKGKAVFEPHSRLSKEEFEKLGYPRPHVNWHETKQRCMERFKNDMKGVEP